MLTSTHVCLIVLSIHLGHLIQLSTMYLINISILFTFTLLYIDPYSLYLKQLFRLDDFL